MKKIGEYTVRGSMADGVIERITLNDGQFDTGYRVVEFKIFPQNALSSSADVAGVLMTQYEGVPSPIWQAESNTQIAWSSTAVLGAASVSAPFEVIDPDNLIIEDLFIHINNTDSAKSNYFVRMEKYSITDWQGALAMVRNNSQNVE